MSRFTKEPTGLACLVRHSHPGSEPDPDRLVTLQERRPVSFVVDTEGIADPERRVPKPTHWPWHSQRSHFLNLAALFRTNAAAAASQILRDGPFAAMMNLASLSVRPYFFAKWIAP